MVSRHLAISSLSHRIRRLPVLLQFISNTAVIRRVDRPASKRSVMGKLTTGLTINQVILILECQPCSTVEWEAFALTLKKEGFLSQLAGVNRHRDTIMTDLPLNCFLLKNTPLKDARVKLRGIATTHGLKVLRCIAFEMQEWSAWVEPTPASQASV